MISEAPLNQTNTTNEDEAFWKKHIALLNASKMTRKEYCRRYEVNYDRFAYWLGKLRNQSGLVAVKLKSSDPIPTKTTLCTLMLSDGKILHIHDHIALSLILERLS